MVVAAVVAVTCVWVSHESESRGGGAGDEPALVTVVLSRLRASYLSTKLPGLCAAHTDFVMALHDAGYAVRWCSWESSKCTGGSSPCTAWVGGGSV